MHISLLLLPGAMGSSVLGMLDVLVAASFMAGQDRADSQPLQIQRVAASLEPVAAFQGIPLLPEVSIEQIEHTDLILIPSLALDTRRPPDFSGQQAVIRWIQQQAAQDARLASVCTGAFLLAETGLLDGKIATTHWAYANLFRECYPAIRLETDASLLRRHDNLFTAGAGIAWQGLLLAVLQGAVSDELLLQLRQAFLLQEHVDGQKPFIGLATAAHQDSLVQQAQDWLKTALAADDALAQAIQRSGLQQRTFQRRFRQACGLSAVHYLQALRMEAAKTLLTTGARPVEEIGQRVGYNDSSFFRRLFRRHTGLSPAEYRRRYRESFGVSTVLQVSAAGL